jgi:hypothetical protein
MSGTLVDSKRTNDVAFVYVKVYNGVVGIMQKITVANDADFKLGEGEYIIVEYTSTHAVTGYSRWTYTCHRAIRAARKQAKKKSGRILVCSNSTPRYQIL